jgi:hypothetical protein
VGRSRPLQIGKPKLRHMGGAGLGLSAFSNRRRRAGALIAIAATVVAAAGFIYMHSNAPTPSPSTFGVPEKGKTLAAVRVGGKLAYFNSVACDSTDPELITVSLGVRDDPVSFYLSSFLGPQAPDGRYVSPVTTLVIGHRPGIAFDQRGSGSLTVSSELQGELQRTRPSSNIKVGSLAFRGTDRSGAQLSGAVTCSP